MCRPATRQGLPRHQDRPVTEAPAGTIPGDAVRGKRASTVCFSRHVWDGQSTRTGRGPRLLAGAEHRRMGWLVTGKVSLE